MKVQYSIYFRIFVYIMNIYKRILIKKESVSWTQTTAALEDLGSLDVTVLQPSNSYLLSH